MFFEILASIKPKSLVKILNKEMKFIVNETIPKTALIQYGVPCTVYLLCTKGKKYNYLVKTNHGYEVVKVKDGKIPVPLNSKVVASFVLKNIYFVDITGGDMVTYFEEIDGFKFLCKRDLLNMTYNQLKKYLGNKTKAYLWEISDLEIFNKPFELCDNNHNFRVSGHMKTILKAPQNWCYCHYCDNDLPF